MKGLAQTCILALISLGVVSATENTCPTDMAIPLHRAFNKEHSDHFYTTKATVASGWKLEGDAARIYDFQAPDTVLFYRMYSPTAVDHFYTTDEAQRNNAINNLGFNDEGIAGYIYPSTSQLCGSVPFYRMYQPTTHDHFYTTNAAERDNAIKNGGYQEEHIAGYVLPI
ncbi:uncharacterized protein ARMOST_14815 [Armillaria ostoyae]|uniref:DUF5648 domain-containing protein n=1 Tax=Armillaria ostoyae TaxID=47428 RepID=A0A284RRL7_ARMOS|nr:uncharacterized protein ARMOST_14815 [Armillaria ostoyae]